MDKISLVVPCYNEQEALPYFYEAACKIVSEMSEQAFEFIFVDDGSKDNTLEIVKKISVEDKRVKYISFSRNFGKESAMYAGLQNATGDYVAIMDADMQDPPSLLPEMYTYVTSEKYDSVATRRVTRDGEPPIRSFFARLFYKVINKMSKTDIVDGARDFRLMNRKMVDAVISMEEYNRFSKGIFGWVGFNTKWLPYVNVERVAGETKWSFWKLFLYSLEGIVAFTTAPLAISSILGFTFCLLAFTFMIIIIIRTMLFGDPVGGWPSLISVMLFIGGIQLFCTGILGQYLSKAYLETKKRPLYVIKEDNFS
ncbi:glycosyltransferase family 2 protein [Lacrimispora sp.]|uniref:glycosyltransferase family 2 protein n=1 Tax=Lacrimispora sp. TaxID=2719234 RepID=UPI00285B10DC|nr:glycosyltransferase family 2 protein [Lacrimispora sp.]MDR7814993.1 glycosyltransferase family 2 protein [Lacrimispora sp.]